MNNKAITTLFVLFISLQTSDLAAQGRGPGQTQDWTKVPERISWHGTWAGGLATAKATGRPILLISAAPSCGGVPGMW